MVCRECGLSSGDDTICTFCRVRNRWWHTLDDLPVALRGWAISTVRIWTGILLEEGEKYLESQRVREEAEKTAAPKSASLVGPSRTPSEGSPKRKETEKVDKSWIDPKREADATKSPKKTTGSPGVVDLSPGEEEGKTSSGSKAAKEDKKTSRKRSRSDKKRDRSRSKRSRRRRRRSSSPRPRSSKREKDRDRRSDQADKGKERKAKPSVRPPRTPSKSPPRSRGGPPPKEPPVERRGGPPDPVARPTGRDWSGPIKPWHRAPQYWGVNKGQKKKENQYYRR